MRAAGNGRSTTRQPFPELTPGDAHAVIRWLCALGKVTARDIRAALRERDSLVAEATRRLENREDQGARFLQSIEGLQRGSIQIDRRTTKMSAKQRAAWKAEVRFLAALKSLPKPVRQKLRTVREKRGVGAALAKAKRLAKLSRPHGATRRSGLG